MPPDERIGRVELERILREIGTRLQETGYQRKFSVYLIGGSLFAYHDINRRSKDIDFIVTQRDYRALHSIVQEIEEKRRVRIGVFLDGDISGFVYPEYAKRAQRLPIHHSHLEVYKIDDAGVAICKIIAGRPQDIDDILLLKSKGLLPSEDDLRETYQTLKFESEARRLEIDAKFETFLRRLREI